MNTNNIFISNTYDLPMYNFFRHIQEDSRKIIIPTSFDHRLQSRLTHL